MADAGSPPPVLKGSSFLVHDSFPPLEKQALISRIKFFSGEITDRISDVEFVILANEVSLNGWSRAVKTRVRDPDWLEDFLKKKLGVNYSTYLNLPTVESHRNDVNDTSSPIPAKSKPLSRMKPRKNVITSSDHEDEEKRNQLATDRYKKQAEPKETPASTTQSLAQNRRHPVASPEESDSEQTESSEEEIPPQHPTETSKSSHQPSHPPYSSRPRNGFASWRVRPRVLVPNSDPSQSASSATANSLLTQQSNPSKSSQLLEAASSRSHIIRDKEIKDRTSHSKTKSPTAESQARSQQVELPAKSQKIESQLDTSEEEFNPVVNSFDEDSNDEWSEKSSEEELESFPLTNPASQYDLPERRRVSARGSVERTSESAGLVDAYWPQYLARAVKIYDEAGPSQTQRRSQSEWGTQATQDWSQSLATGSAKTTGRKQEQRRRLIAAALPLLSHWLQIPLPKVRNVWKNLPRQKRTFEELQKWCLERDLSSTRKEYDDTKLFTQPSPRSRRRESSDESGPARKKRNLGGSSLRRRSSSNTDYEEESEVYIGGQDPDASFGWYGVELDNDDDGVDEPPPIRFRQTRLVAGSAKSRFPYPTRPDRVWAKRICRMLGALYGVSASRVYTMWEAVDGDAKRVEDALKERTGAVIPDLGLGEIPRPWV